MGCSAPGSSVLCDLLECAQDLCPLSWWCCLTISPSVTPLFSCLKSFPASGSFPMNLLFASGGQSIGASASVLPMNIQDWFPLELTGLISLMSKGLPRVFSSATIWKHQLFGAQPPLGCPGGTSGKEPACQGRRRKRDGFHPESGRSPGEGNGDPLQYSCLENSMDRGAGYSPWGLKGQTRLKQLSTAFFIVQLSHSYMTGKTIVLTIKQRYSNTN